MEIATIAAILHGVVLGFLGGTIYSVTLREIDLGTDKIRELWKLLRWLAGDGVIGIPWLFVGTEPYYYYLVYLVALLAVFAIIVVASFILWWIV